MASRRKTAVDALRSVDGVDSVDAMDVAEGLPEGAHEVVLPEIVAVDEAEPAGPVGRALRWPLGRWGGRK